VREKRGTKDAQDLVSELSGRDIKAEASLYLMVLLFFLVSFALSLSLYRSLDDSRLREGGFTRNDAGIKGARGEGGRRKKPQLEITASIPEQTLALHRQ